MENNSEFALGTKEQINDVFKLYTNSFQPMFIYFYQKKKIIYIQEATFALSVSREIPRKLDSLLQHF